MKALFSLFVALAPTALAAQPASVPDVELWRLDCGSIEVRDLNMFSDTMAYPGQTKTLTNSCYLIRHGQDYMLWDAGLAQSLRDAPAAEDAPAVSTPGPALTEQLDEIDVSCDRIGRLGISHAHFDHMGQATDFPGATLMLGAADWQALQSKSPGFGIEPTLAKPWLDGGAVDAVRGDRDVFGDGSVTMLAMPGHTQGETALLVRLAQTGPVLLSGDVVHFAEQMANTGVPPFNVSRADSLASMQRIEALAQSTGARLVIQHDAGHVGRLPVFPASAR